MTDRQKWYREVYLKSDHWNNKRKEKLQHNPVCEICGKDKGLQIHHLNYNSLGFENIEDLMTLCTKCHSHFHGKKKAKKEKKKNSLITLEEYKLVYERMGIPLNKDVCNDELNEYLDNKLKIKNEKYNEFCSSIYNSKDLKGLIYVNTESYFMDLLYENFKNFIMGENNFFVDNKLNLIIMDNSFFRLVENEKLNYERVIFNYNNKTFSNDMKNIGYSISEKYMTSFGFGSLCYSKQQLEIKFDKKENSNLLNAMKLYFNYNNDNEAVAILNDKAVVFNKNKIEFEVLGRKYTDGKINGYFEI